MCCKNYVKSVQNPRTPGIYSIENIAVLKHPRKWPISVLHWPHRTRPCPGSRLCQCHWAPRSYPEPQWEAAS